MGDNGTVTGRIVVIRERFRGPYIHICFWRTIERLIGMDGGVLLVFIKKSS